MRQLLPDEFLHLSEKDCVEIQISLSSQVVQCNSFHFESLHTIAGVDIAYWNENNSESAVCCIVVIDFQTGKIIETQHTVGKVKFPYIPGCLAFRELPLVLETAVKLKQKPDIFLFDGNGLLHPRGMGLASHASFYLEAPCVGIAKHYFNVESAKFIMPDNIPGSYSDITRDGQILGRAIRTHQNVKPIYVSVGNYIDIDTVTKLALMLTDSESHIPTPTRYADLQTHIQRKLLQGMK